jgi:hypothetical protein
LPGAIVQVNGQTVGPTPVDAPFVHYGTYRITIFRDGFQPLVVDQPVPAPWYEWWPLEFVSENLIPFDIQDHRWFNFTMTPLQVPPAEAIQARAEILRQEGHGIGVPFNPPNMVPLQPPANLETLPTPNPVPSPVPVPPAAPLPSKLNPVPVFPQPGPVAPNQPTSGQ